MNRKLTINDLHGFGLTQYESRIYLALMEKKRLKASEVAQLADIPRARIYEDLKSLEAKGLCQSISGKTRLFSATDPSQLHDILIRLEKDKIESRKMKFELDLKKKKDEFQTELQEQEKQLEDKIKKANDLVELLVPIFKESRDNENDLDYMEIIKDPHLANAKVCEFLVNAKFEVLGFNKPPFVRESESEQIESNKVALKRNITVKIIYEIPSDREEIISMMDEIKYAQDEGEFVKVIDHLPTKMSIFDEEISLYTLHDPLTHKISLTTSIVRHKSLAQLLKISFNAIWDKAKDPSVLKDMI